MTVTKGTIKTTFSAQYMHKKHLSELNNDYDFKKVSSKLVLNSLCPTIRDPMDYSQAPLCM